jgi:hypothetical protein
MIYETRDLLGMHHRIQYRRRIQVGPCDGFIVGDGGREVDSQVGVGMFRIGHIVGVNAMNNVRNVIRL